MIRIVYWSGPGNTESMASAVADGVKAAGAVLIADGVIAHNEPDAEAVAACESLGRTAAEQAR